MVFLDPFDPGKKPLVSLKDAASVSEPLSPEGGLAAGLCGVYGNRPVGNATGQDNGV